MLGYSCDEEGRPIVPAYKVGRTGRVVVHCLFCGCVHTHGDFGARVAHCGDGRRREYRLRPAGAAPRWLLSLRNGRVPKPSELAGHRSAPRVVIEHAKTRVEYDDAGDECRSVAPPGAGWVAYAGDSSKTWWRRVRVVPPGAA